jgi:hypothetical protein
MSQSNSNFGQILQIFDKRAFLQAVRDADAGRKISPFRIGNRQFLNRSFRIETS